MNPYLIVYFIFSMSLITQFAEGQNESEVSKNKKNWLITMNTPLASTFGGSAASLPNGIQYLRISEDGSSSNVLSVASGVAYNITGSFYAGANVGYSRIWIEDLSVTSYALGPMVRYYIDFGSKSSIIVGAAAQWGDTRVSDDFGNENIPSSIYSGTLAYSYALGVSSALEVQINYDQFTQTPDSFDETMVSALSLRIGFTIFL